MKSFQLKDTGGSNSRHFIPGGNSAAGGRCLSGAPKVQAADLMEGISAKTASGKAADSRFIGNTVAFAVDLSRKPLPPMKTRSSPRCRAAGPGHDRQRGGRRKRWPRWKELGRDMGIDELNEYLYAYVPPSPADESSISLSPTQSGSATMKTA